MHVAANFHSGNIEVLELGATRARLAIRQDQGSKHLQWFHFLVSGAKGQALELRLENASRASYEGGWRDYRACMSVDRETWTRVPTRYEAGELIIEHTPDADLVWYAYFAPYDEARHQALLGRCQQAPGVEAEVLGATLDGRTLDLLRFGEGPKVAWVIARQHPGETMAEWHVEGLLERLLDPADALARELRRALTFHVVPNMNPDGSARGHLRTNAAGTNLNRAWAEPSMEKSPEVQLVRDRMDRTGVSFCLDVHGDEALPYNFIAGSDGVGDLPDAIHALRPRYEAALVRACPDFQTKHGYPRAAPREGNLKMATNQVAHRYGALAMTLEMPFKDNADAPDPVYGWSPARCKGLGRAQLDALREVLPDLPDSRPL
ncbi:MAG: M14-type cytosolic carboxypeptidase [Myxococcota bacterium]